MTAPAPRPAINGHQTEEANALRVLRERVGQRLAEAAQASALDPARYAGLVEQVIADLLDEHARDTLRQARRPLSTQAESRISQALRDAFLGLGGLQPLLDDPNVETININGCDCVRVRYTDGRRSPVAAVAGSDEELAALLRALAARGAHERRFDTGSPELSMQLPDGSRLFALREITDRVVASIRRLPLTQVTLPDLVRRGEMSSALGQVLASMVRARRNLVISGGPAAGKTTLLRALAAAIPRDERIITIEDAYELALSRAQHPDLVAMQARQANVEGTGSYDIAQAVRASLRLSPDRVIVGEARGAEVVQVAKAMSIGIDGSMTTVHASSSRQAFLRLITYAMEPPALYPREAATALIGGAVHVVIHLDTTPQGVRVISSVREVVDSDGDQVVSNEVWAPGQDRRAVPATPLRAQTVDRLVAAGLDPTVLAADRW